MRNFLLGSLLLFVGLTQLGFKPPADPITVYLFMGEKCVICRHYTLPLNQLHQQYKDQGVRFVGIFSNGYSTAEGIAAFKEKYDLPFELRLDPDQKMLKQFGARITPEVFVYHPKSDQILYQGRIDDQYVRVGRRRPAPTTSELADVLHAHTHNLPVDVAPTEAVGCFITQAAVCK